MKITDWLTKNTHRIEEPTKEPMEVDDDMRELENALRMDQHKDNERTAEDILKDLIDNIPETS